MSLKKKIRLYLFVVLLVSLK